MYRAREPITAANILQLFPEIDASLAKSAKESSELSGYDEEQVKLMDEVCIVLDEEDRPIGSASKKVCMYPSFSFPPVPQYMCADGMTNRPLDGKH